ncbi:hypothetical protein K2X33_05610, partial [bacterium]|nr:hypothetical protein [bacterium]
SPSSVEPPKGAAETELKLERSIRKQIALRMGRDYVPESRAGKGPAGWDRFASAGGVWYERNMALDPMEKDRLRKQMATRMHVILEGGKSVQCVSGHYYEEPAFCDLCQQRHVQEQVVIRNRANKNFHVATACLREMVRFQVTDAEGFAKWLEKMKDLRADFEGRKAELQQRQQEERSRLEKKVIVRKRDV